MTIQPLHTFPASLAAVLAASIIAVLCGRAKLLTTSGAVAAAGTGAVVFACGGIGGAAALLTFFLTSNLLGRFRRAGKTRLGFEKGGRRDAWQVLANGGAAAMLAILACVPHLPSAALRVAFLAALAEANADTWATEIGAGFAWTPRTITTFKRATPGESGAVSLPGTLAALAGAALIGAFAADRNSLLAAFAVTLSGFAGALTDSLLGATVQAQYIAPGQHVSEREVPGSRLVRGVRGVNNDVVNFLATLAAAGAASAIWLAFAH